MFSNGENTGENGSAQTLSHFSPSLPNICEQYGFDHDIISNSKKRLTMLFKPKKLKDLISAPLYL